MPNVGGILKQEIMRLARKEARAQVDSLRKASVQYRRAIAELKREIAQVRRDVASSRRMRPAPTQPAPSDANAVSHRFSAKGLATNRRRLGLSALQYAKLLGVSSQSIYNWEAGTTRPAASQLQALASLRTIGKKEAQSRLAALNGEARA